MWNRVPRPEKIQVSPWSVLDELGDWYSSSNYTGVRIPRAYWRRWRLWDISRYLNMRWPTQCPPNPGHIRASANPKGDLQRVTGFLRRHRLAILYPRLKMSGKRIQGAASKPRVKQYQFASSPRANRLTARTFTTSRTSAPASTPAAAPAIPHSRVAKMEERTIATHPAIPDAIIALSLCQRYSL